MSVLVNRQGEQEEKVLQAFLDQYNKEIDQADAEIEAGNYVSHQNVEEMFKKRKKAV